MVERETILTPLASWQLRDTCMLQTTQRLAGAPIEVAINFMSQIPPGRELRGIHATIAGALEKSRCQEVFRSKDVCGDRGTSVCR